MDRNAMRHLGQKESQGQAIEPQLDPAPWVSPRGEGLNEKGKQQC